MKHYLFTLNGYGEMFKKKFSDTSLFAYAKKDNLDIISLSGRWGYVSLGKTLEKAHYTFFDVENNFPGEAYIRGWKELSAESVKEKTFFICRFMMQSGGVVIETNAGLSEQEIAELLNLLSKNGKEFRFLIKNGSAILMFRDNFPREEVIFPDNMKGLNLKLHLYKKQELANINNLILSSISLLENHPVNRVRQDLGEISANMLWLWGAGRHTEFPDIASKLDKELFYISTEGEELSLPQVFNFNKINDIKSVPDNSLIWINSAVDRQSNYSVWLKKLECLDTEIITEVLKEYQKGVARVLFIFDGFVSKDAEIKNPWSPFLYISENSGKIRFKKKFKNSCALLKLFLE